MLAFQLHNDLAFEHVDERIGIVPMDHVLCARRIRHLNHATLLARVVREIDREQFLHVGSFGRNGCEHQQCRHAGAEVQVRSLHTLFLSASWSGPAIPGERESARSITTCAPAMASLRPSPVTVFEAIRPVPPMTTIFMVY